MTLISKDQIARGDTGVYQKADDKVYLDGNVSLTQGPNVTLGDHIVYDLHTAEAVVTGHVRSLFLPDSDNGSPGAAKNPKRNINPAPAVRSRRNDERGVAA